MKKPMPDTRVPSGTTDTDGIEAAVLGASQPDTGSEGFTGESTRPRPVTLRLLHVEDSPADALLTQEYLRDLVPDVAFDTVTRLSEVTIERVEAADCALLDLSLPDASGLDALLALRAMSEDLPIIVLTGLDELTLGLAAVRRGADDYLLKNHVDGHTLERAVRYAIERRGLMLQLAESAAETILATAPTVTALAAASSVFRLMDEHAASDPSTAPAQAGDDKTTAPTDHESHLGSDDRRTGA